MQLVFLHLEFLGLAISLAGLNLLLKPLQQSSLLSLSGQSLLLVDFKRRHLALSIYVSVWVQNFNTAICSHQVAVITSSHSEVVSSYLYRLVTGLLASC